MARFIGRGRVAMAAICLLAAVWLGSALAAAKTKPKPLEFRVSLITTTVHYDLVISKGACTLGETDNFTMGGSYQPFSIPRKGPASSTINRDGLILGAGEPTSWKEYAHGCPSGGNYVCTGELQNGDDGHLVSGPGTAAKELHLILGTASPSTGWYVTNGQGNYPADLGGCAGIAKHTTPFQEARGYMPEMLEPKVDLPLASLRKLKVGQKWQFPVSDAEVPKPPFSCGQSGGSVCTQHLSWSGHVRVTRTQ